MSWRYAIEVLAASGRWDWWGGANHGAGAVSTARRYAQHPDRAVRVIEVRTGRVVWTSQVSSLPGLAID